MRQHPASSTPGYQAGKPFRQISWLALKYGAWHSLPYPYSTTDGRGAWQQVCRRGQRPEAWACLGRVAQSLLAASQPGGEPRRPASNSGQCQARHVPGEAHWTLPDSPPHKSTPRAVRAKSVPTCNASQKLFLATWPSKTRRQVVSQPCNTTGPNHGFPCPAGLDGDSCHHARPGPARPCPALHLGTPSCSWVRFEPFQHVLLPSPTCHIPSCPRTASITRQEIKNRS